MTTINHLNIDTETKKNLSHWLSPDYDEETRKKVQTLMNSNQEELINSFYTKLNFGTGGLRGLMGVGSNRMNRYTVSFATQGLAYHLNNTFKNQPIRVFIGYDTRLHSKEFAETGARVLAGNNIEVLISSTICPTPYTSFACRHFHCNAAIMVTASHNPAKYNGYKVYWQDGGQVLPPHDSGIVKQSDAINSPKQVKLAPLNSPLIQQAPLEGESIYIEKQNSLQLYPGENKEHGKKLKIIYTNLHGTGITLTPPVLKEWGFSNLSLVEKQATLDGHFPTAPFPNPEVPQSLELGVQQLIKENGDILIANDPDADRMRALVLHNNEVEWLNGNQLACIMLYHTLRGLKQKNKLPKKGAVIKTIVTTELFSKIAEHYDLACFDVLTGFKYISQKIHEWETTSDGFSYIYGGEESYGTLRGAFSRDKDAVIASAVIAEAALLAKLKGQTLVDTLHTIYQKFGVYGEKLQSITFPETKEGHLAMKQGMQRLRKNPLTEIAGIKVVALGDYQTSVLKNFSTNEETCIDLPQSNVLLYYLEDESKLIIRPSGTEPKIKIYTEALRNTSNIQQGMQQAKDQGQVMIEAVQAILA